MTKTIPIHKHKGLVRDLDSKAILNTDVKALHEHRNKKLAMKTLFENVIKIEKLENDISDIKNLLLQLTNKGGVDANTTNINQ